MSDQPDYSGKSPSVSGTLTNSWQAFSECEKKPATIKGDLAIKYPYDWGDEFFADLIFDDREIPFANRPGLQKECYDPTLISAYGLYNHNKFLQDGDILRRYTALRMADWLQANLQEWGELFYAWPLEYNEPFYDISQPWVSCQTQGLAISLLLRVAFFNNDAGYEETALKAVKLFFVSSDAGGLVSRFEDGGLAFESFPGKNQALPLIGNIFAIVGIFELAHYFKDRNQETVFNSAVTGLVNNIERYNNKKWLLKDLHPSRRVATKSEVATIVDLLHILGKLSEDKTLVNWADRWQENYASQIGAVHYFFRTHWDDFRFRKAYSSDV